MRRHHDARDQLEHEGSDDIDRKSRQSSNRDVKSGKEPLVEMRVPEQSKFDILKNNNLPYNEPYTDPSHQTVPTSKPRNPTDSDRSAPATQMNITYAIVPSPSGDRPPISKQTPMKNVTTDMARDDDEQYDNKWNRYAVYVCVLFVSFNILECYLTSDIVCTARRRRTLTYY